MNTPAPPGAAPAPLTAPLPDLSAWVRHFAEAPIPILADTAEAIESLRENEDDVDANMLGELIAGDPLMSLKLMAHAARHRSERVLTDPETVTATIVMMGITPFFRAFGPQPSVQDQLAGRPPALDGLYGVLRRGRRAAQFALGFAVHRLDPHTSTIHQAALLHDFAEALLWVHAPDLALGIQAAQAADPHRRSAEVQREHLNIELIDLQQALMKRWRLSDMLTQISDDRHADHPSVRNVLLAIRVARHSAQGWSDPALPDDYAEIGQLLQLAPDKVQRLLLDIDR